MECVERTKAVAKAMEEKQFELAVELRGRSFARNLETYKMLTRLKPPKEVTIDGKPHVSDMQIICIIIHLLIFIGIYYTFQSRAIEWPSCILGHQLVV